MAPSSRSRLKPLLEDVSITSAAVDALDLLNQNLLVHLAHEISTQSVEKTRVTSTVAVDRALDALGLKEISDHCVSRPRKRKRMKARESTEELLAEQEKLLTASRQKLDQHEAAT